LALHVYDTDPQAVMNYIEHWHTKYDKDVAVTEFACQVCAVRNPVFIARFDVVNRRTSVEVLKPTATRSGTSGRL
jgi:hypothetical protein